MATQVKSPEVPRALTNKSKIDVGVVLPFAIFVVAYFLVPRFAQERTLVSLNYIGIYAILALGLNLLMGYAGQISLGHAAFYGLGAYTSAILACQPVAAETIPSLASGIGVMAGMAALMSLTRISGWKLAAGVAALFVLTWLSRLLHGNLPISFVLFAAGMAIFGFALKIGWLKSGISGIVAVAVGLVAGRFLSGVLARGGASPWVGMFAGVLITGLIAYLIGAQVLRLKGHYLAMATLGFGEIVDIVFKKWVAVTGGSSDGIYGIPTIAFTDGLPKPIRHIFEMAAGGRLDPKQQYYYLVWGFVFVALLLSINIVRSRVGRAFRAVHGSEQAAESLGVDTERYKVQVFVLSAALASIAGSLHAHNAGVGYISPSEFDVMVSVELVVMVVIGGMASVWGALFGATAIQLLNNWILTLGKSDRGLFGLPLKGIDPVVFGAILIIVMIVLPQGLVRGLTDSVTAAIRGIRRQAKEKVG